ncbi:CSC1-like protein [Abeliophyllum distichum]|uniref:CSC1-like protein n=1 Tax=Abeliophyllum distichum TaxID=126358 RepID=A0ABD1RFL3_9LAMI
MIPIVFVQSLENLEWLERVAPFLMPLIKWILRNIGISIPTKITFYITYIMVNGWAGIASKIIRLKPLVIFHMKNMFIVKTERDLEKAMNPGGVDFLDSPKSSIVNNNETNFVLIINVYQMSLNVNNNNINLMPICR